jgi:hypothetical protein
VIIHKNNPKKIAVIMYNLISHPNMNHIQRNREKKSNAREYSMHINILPPTAYGNQKTNGSPTYQEKMIIDATLQ